MGYLLTRYLLLLFVLGRLLDVGLMGYFSRVLSVLSFRFLFIFVRLFRKWQPATPVRAMRILYRYKVSSLAPAAKKQFWALHREWISMKRLSTLPNVSLYSIDTEHACFVAVPEEVDLETANVSQEGRRSCKGGYRRCKVEMQEVRGKGCRMRKVVVVCTSLICIWR